MTQAERNTVLLALSGSVAAYKGAEIARGFLRRGHPVQALMTPSATRFLGPATLLGITGQPVLTELFDGDPGERHVDVWRRATAMVIAPATADLLARLAQGRASDVVSATALCRNGPLFVAPAMHPRMWSSPAVQRNVKRLQQDGVLFLGPAEGEVASGDRGVGRMWEPEAIVEAVLGTLAKAAASSLDLQGLCVVVTAGPTVEDLDPVRFLSNRSTGKMGYALARAAILRGANVELVTGPVALEPPPGVNVHRVRSALELEQVLGPLADRADAVLMAAAVGDYRPLHVSPTKLKKSSQEAHSTLELVQNPDVIAGIGRRRHGARPWLVAFAVETGGDPEIAERAEEKRRQKGVDLIVANSAQDGFGGDDNRVQLVTEAGSEALPRSSKLELAHVILDRVREACPRVR